ncbi:response regulator [Neptuniibacter sp. QD37_6]|uniref:response regulator n=1 Tax=Neptuniibacter sp. QD37_6 TaxID=3398210 RepID=UPI0039F4C6E1
MSQVMDQQMRILLVDDQSDNLDILSEILGSKYEVSAATSGEKALSIIQELSPDLVLLDVLMPGMNGFEVCQNIKAVEESQNIDVIFVSALDSKEKIVAGYEAGAIDYITKPISPDEVIRKVELALENRHKNAQLFDGHKQALEAANNAITTAGEQGQIIDFLRKTFTCNSIEALARTIIQSNQLYGFDCSVQIRAGDNVQNFNGLDSLSPLEEEFLNQVQNAGRLYEKGRFFVANYGGITLLIKNMPDDEGKRGRFRDHLAIIAEGAESRLNALMVTHAIDGVLSAAQSSLKDIQEFQWENKLATLRIIDELSDKVEASFLSYGLTEEQEVLLEKAVEETENKVRENIEKGIMVDERLQSIVTRLEECSALTYIEESEECEQLLEDDVELF